MDLLLNPRVLVQQILRIRCNNDCTNYFIMSWFLIPRKVLLLTFKIKSINQIVFIQYKCLEIGPQRADNA